MTAQWGPRVHPWKQQLSIPLSGHISCLHLFSKSEINKIDHLFTHSTQKPPILTEHIHISSAKITLCFILHQIHFGVNYTKSVNTLSHRSIPDIECCLWRIRNAYCFVLVQEQTPSVMNTVCDSDPSACLEEHLKSHQLR